MITEKLIQSLIKNHYLVKVFDVKEKAADYLYEEYSGCVIGFGDSMTIKAMDLNRRLSEKNTVYDPNVTKSYVEFRETADKTLLTELYITSANALTETGIFLNMDRTGNRVAASLYGHRKKIYIVGSNKIVPDLESGIRRIRETAAPANARRLGYHTPCALTGRCADCHSEDRLCNALVIQYKAMAGMEEEVLLLEEPAGY